MRKQINRRSALLQMAAGVAVMAPAVAMANAHSTADEKKLKTNSAEDEIRTLRSRVRELEDVRELQNLMARYCASVRASQFLSGGLDLFAHDSATVCVEEIGMRRWEGREELQRWCQFRAAEADRNRRGGVPVELDLTTPSIAVTDDGNTAHALWSVSGYRQAVGETCRVHGKIHVDFLREDGEWKIWHLRFQTSLMAPLESSWRGEDDHGRVKRG
jgi:hypothetical protein